MSVTLRGTNLAFGTGNSITISLPTGTVSGDTAIVFANNGWSVNTPSGWTALVVNNTTSWQGAIFTKVLTSGDITTGTMTVTFSSSFDGDVVIATVVGSGFVIGVGSTQSSFTVTSFGPSHNGDLFLYYGSNRATSTNSFNRGTSRQAGTNSGNASACLYTEAISANGGPLTTTCTYSAGAGGGSYTAIVTLTTSGVSAIVTHEDLLAIVPSATPKAYISQEDLLAIVPSATTKGYVTQLSFMVIVSSSPPRAQPITMIIT